MIGFFIKKSFFDGWDNLFRLVLVNVPLSALVGAEATVAYVMFSARNGVPLSIVEFLALAAIHVLVCVCSGAAAWFANRMADFDKPAFRDLLEGFKKTAARSALFGLLSSVLAGLFILCIRFYGSRGDILSNLAMGLVFWCGIFCLISLQYFNAVMVRLGGNFIKVLRKCFLLSVDNLGFSVFLWIWTLIMNALTVVTAGLLPGTAGVQLALCDAVRLRVYKYDWLEKNPDAKRNAAPWQELLAGDEELLGPRSLKGMIFPWKDEQR